MQLISWDAEMREEIDMGKIGTKRSNTASPLVLKGGGVRYLLFTNRTMGSNVV